ncbi:acetyl-coenzyme A synthetase [Pyricularia oryzae]|nr:acetyl-coenzyme A synthetase [Pyricularia oryzae]
MYGCYKITIVTKYSSNLAAPFILFRRGANLSILSATMNEGIERATEMESREIYPPEAISQGFAEYQRLYKQSITNPNEFWARMAREHLTWQRDFQTVMTGSFRHGDVAWFLEGQLNAAYNMVDRHMAKHANSPAVIFEADEPGEGYTLTYSELLREVCKLAHVLRDMGVRKGDTVVIYMPVIPEAIIAFLAVVRIGAVHSAVFAGFSASALRDRILDARCKVVITADEARRGGKTIGLKGIVDLALQGHDDCCVAHVLVYKRTGAAAAAANDVPFTPGRDLWWHQEVEKWPPYMAPETVNSEDPLFLLYTSGSTGKPKGVLHSTAGYLLGAAVSGKYAFDVHDGGRYFCAGDFGWITGHTYAVYAPLLLGVATVVFEGTPTYPSASRCWDIISAHGVTHFYTAPTALRLLKRAAGSDGDVPRMPTLRVLGSVGEPIAPEVWKWYFEVVGKGRAHVVDVSRSGAQSVLEWLSSPEARSLMNQGQTYFQTETGSHAITPLAGVTPVKPGSASLPFFGIAPAILDPISGREILTRGVEGVLVFKQPWPSMARTVRGAHQRFMDTYLRFTGDLATCDHDGHYWIRGRVDDVVNVSGHRLSTAEIEAALLEHPAVAESAAIAVPDDVTGQAVNAFVSVKDDSGGELDGLQKEFILQVRKCIGPFAAPKQIYVVPDLPKTRSGKIMRRVLRKILLGEVHADQLGDMSTLINPTAVDVIIAAVHGTGK